MSLLSSLGGIVEMQPAAAHRVVWSVCVCLLVTLVNPAKMTEPIAMLFGIWGLGAQGTIY